MVYVVLQRRGKPREGQFWEQIKSYWDEDTEIALLKTEGNLPETFNVMIEWRVEGLVVRRAKLGVEDMTFMGVRFDWKPEGFQEIDNWFKIAHERRLAGDDAMMVNALTVGEVGNNEIHTLAANAFEFEQRRLLLGIQNDFSIQIDGLYPMPDDALPYQPLDDIWNIFNEDEDDGLYDS